MEIYTPYLLVCKIKIQCPYKIAVPGYILFKRSGVTWIFCSDSMCIHLHLLPEMELLSKSIPIIDGHVLYGRR